MHALLDTGLICLLIGAAGSGKTILSLACFRTVVEQKALLEDCRYAIDTPGD